MVTWQDLVEINERKSDRDKIQFVFMLINTHKNTQEYEDALVAVEYAKQRNKTIMDYQKLLYTMTGKAVPDNYSANYKLASNFFYRFVTQQNQYLLGNGISWNNDDTKELLGDSFDNEVQKAGYNALVSGVSFGFWNLDHLDVFTLQEFAPLYDEENGALMAGVRFWQLDKSKPMRATLYEPDGYTDYVWDGEGQILHEKRPYILKIRSSQIDGDEIYDGANYPSFPIVPLFGNQHKQSELIGLRSEIDAYDLIKSGFANDLDDASQIYWIVQNAGGMDDVDLAKFIERLKTVKAAVVDDDGARAESHTIDVPYAAREALLERLRADMYDDFMALDTKAIAGGAVTATQIRAAYEPMNNKADMYEYQLIEFLKGILFVAGIDDDPSFTRSIIINVQEDVNTVLSASGYLSETYITEKILNILGDADKIEDVLKEMDEDELDRASLVTNKTPEQEEGTPEDFGEEENEE